MTAGGRQQTRFDELARQIGEMVRAVDRLTINVEAMGATIGKLDRWAWSNSDGAKTAEARIAKLENERASDLRYEAKQTQRITWAIMLTAIVSSSLTAVLIKLLG